MKEAEMIAILTEKFARFETLNAVNTEKLTNILARADNYAIKTMAEAEIRHVSVIARKIMKNRNIGE